MLTGEGRLTCVISSRPLDEPGVDGGVFVVPRMAENRLVLIIISAR